MEEATWLILSRFQLPLELAVAAPAVTAATTRTRMAAARTRRTWDDASVTEVTPFVAWPRAVQAAPRPLCMWMLLIIAPREADDHDGARQRRAPRQPVARRAVRGPRLQDVRR